MNHIYTFVALDLANERAIEARETRQSERLAAGFPERPSIIRRGLALGLAAVSRGSATAARRIDDATPASRSADLS